MQLTTTLQKALLISLFSCLSLFAIGQSTTTVIKDWEGNITSIEKDFASVYVITLTPNAEGLYPTRVFAAFQGEWDPEEKENYQEGFVNSPDEALRSGPWVTYSSGNKVDEGRYDQDKESGFWTYYYDSGAIKDQGTYVAGEKDGDWDYYFKSGEKSGEVTYQHGDVTAFTYFNKDGSLNPSEEDANRQPAYPGGEQALYDFLVTKMRYPRKSRREGIEGRLYVQFVIRPNGVLDHAKVVRGLAPDLDAEALRVVNAMPRWEGAKNQNRPVPVKMIIPISYRL